MELRDDGENRESSEGRQTNGIERVEDGVDGRQTRVVEAMEDGVEGRQARVNEEIDGFEGRQAKVSEKMEDGGVRQGGSRQSRLAWKGDGGGSEEANGVGMCSPMKVTGLFYKENPSHGPIPP